MLRLINNANPNRDFDLTNRVISSNVCNSSYDITIVAFFFKMGAPTSVWYLTVEL